MQFVDRSMDWGKKPNASFMQSSIDSPGHRGGSRRRSRSRKKQEPNFAYVSIMSSHRNAYNSSTSRSKSVPKRSTSVKSQRNKSKSKSRPKQFKTIREKLYRDAEQAKAREESKSPDGFNESSIPHHLDSIQDTMADNSLINPRQEELPKTRVIKIKRKKKRVIRNVPKKAFVSQ